MWLGPREFAPLRDCEAACERSGSGVIILSGGVWFCSGTSVMGPAWRWLFGAVRSSSLGFSVGARSQREFSGSFLRVYVGGRRAPYCFLSFWLCSLFFLYVVFHDYLLVFIPSLSMKWAPFCAGSFKKKKKDARWIHEINFCSPSPSSSPPATTQHGNLR